MDGGVSVNSYYDIEVSLNEKVDKVCLKLNNKKQENLLEMTKQENKNDDKLFWIPETNFDESKKNDSKSDAKNNSSHDIEIDDLKLVLTCTEDSVLDAIRTSWINSGKILNASPSIMEYFAEDAKLYERYEYVNRFKLSLVFLSRHVLINMLSRLCMLRP